MSELFELEWMGGVAEYHYRKARPGVDDFAWATLDPSKYAPSLISAAQRVWTGVAISEYAAIAAFAQVVGALAQAKAPLDLTGMTSDFLADEVRHVELVSRLIMQLGGAAPRSLFPRQLVAPPEARLTSFQAANDLVLSVSCIAEAFAGSTAAPMMRASTHPLIRSVYASILRDEARHQRLGGLYFDWARERIDDAEYIRLGHTAFKALSAYASLWQGWAAARPCDPTAEGWSASDVHDLGWFESAKYKVFVRSVVREELLPSLARLGITMPEGAEARLQLG
jgi:hypothetical protein